MGKITIEVDIKQIEKAIEKLSPEDQRKLEEKLWRLQMENIVRKMRRFARENKVTERQIKKLCEEVRQELYEEKIKGGG